MILWLSFMFISKKLEITFNIVKSYYIFSKIRFMLISEKLIFNKNYLKIFLLLIINKK